MGRFKSNILAQPHCHRPPRDSLDLDGRLSGSLAAFKFAISAGFEKIRSDSFRKVFAPRPIPLFQKMRGWLRIDSQLADRAGYLRLAETVTSFLARLRETAKTLDVAERQRIVQLLVKEILVDDDTIVIRHSIPAPTESTDSSGRPPAPKVANRQATQVTFCVRGVMSGQRVEVNGALVRGFRAGIADHMRHVCGVA